MGYTSRKRLFYVISILFVFFIPFYDVPRTFRSGISVSMILGFIIIILLIFLKSKSGYRNIKIPILLIIPFLLFLYVYIISFYVSFSYNVKGINHIVFYLISFTIYSLVTFYVTNEIGTYTFSKVLSWAVICVSFIGFYEISLFYLFDYSTYATFLNHGQNVGIFNGFARLRSTFNEPSHFALFIIPVFPILIYGKHWFAVVVGSLALILTFSSSAFSGLIIAILLFFPLFIIRFMKKGYFYTFFFLIIFSIISLVFYKFIYADFYNKVFNVQEIDHYRYHAWVATLNKILESPILGYGPASYYSYLDMGVFSWYLQIGVESGIIGLLSLICLILSSFYIAFKSKMTMSSFFLVAFYVQMITMNHYYIPGFWTLLGFMFARYYELNNLEKEGRKIK